MTKIKVPLEIVEVDPNSYHIFIPCIINDTVQDILIDTGASRTVFDMHYLTDEVSEVVYDEIMSSGLSPGHINTIAGKLKNFSISNHTWENLDAMFMDLSHINELYKRISHKKIAGLIGGDFLYRTKALINYEKCLFKFYIPSKTKALFG